MLMRGVRERMPPSMFLWKHEGFETEDAMEWFFYENMRVSKQKMPSN